MLRKQDISFSDKLALMGVDRPPADPGMLLEFIQKMADERSLPALPRSLEELQARRLPLQKKLRHSLGLDPWPAPTPLNVKICGKLEREGYRIEKLVYEAWPGVFVTAHLYVPEHLAEPAPGLVYACGHWMEAGKLAPVVQSFCASTALMGMVSLVYDPLGQGERMESWRDHGNLKALLVGECQLGWMVWESIRALDYLMTRQEVDPEKVAMTGASGGGLNAFFTTAIDERFACAIPVAYPCTFSAAMQAERDLNWEDGTDVCNQVPNVMSYAEMSDIASLFLPKPYMILSAKRDRMFPISGSRQVADLISHNYQLAGVPDHFRFIEFDEEHGYPLSMREAAYGWLKLWLFGEGDGSSIPEANLDLLPDPFPVEYSLPPAPTPEHIRNQSPTLTPVPGALPGFCLPFRHMMKSQSIFNTRLNKTARQLDSNLPRLSNLIGFPAYQEQIRRSIRKVLGQFPQKNPLQTRLFNQVWVGQMMAERITFQSEPDISVPGLLLLPGEWQKPLPFVIYVGEWGKTQGIQSGMLESLVQAGYGVLALDVRGVGESAASDFEAATNLLMMDRPLFGQRVLDVMRAVDFIWERCIIGPQIDKGRLVILGEGVAGLWGLFAAALDTRVAAVIAWDTLYSYSGLLEEGVSLPASVYLFEVLKYFDLANVMAACAPRPVYLRPVDGFRKKCSAQVVSKVMHSVKIAFSMAGARKNTFRVSSNGNLDRIPRWLDKVLVD